MLVCVICALHAVSLAQGEGTLTIGGFSELSEGYQMLHERYPDAETACVPLSALSTDALVSALLTKSFDCDVYSLSTDAFDLHRSSAVCHRAPAQCASAAVPFPRRDEHGGLARSDKDSRDPRPPCKREGRTGICLPYSPKEPCFCRGRE